jgi:hypothetical protein
MAKKNFSRTDKAPTAGFLEVWAYKGAGVMVTPEGVGFDPTRTRAKRVYADKNVVVEDGRELINLIMAGEAAADPITYVVTGTGGYTGVPDVNVPPDAPSPAAHDLRIPLYSQVITRKDRLNRMSTTYVCVIDKNNSNGQITEWGMKTASGKLFSYRTTKPLFKDPDVVFVVRWTIQH